MRAVERTSEIWRDRGPWLLLLVLPLAALAFRRGWLALIPLAVLVMPAPARAVTWDDLWARPEQQAARALERGDPALAAGVARDPLWKGGALYRGGQYEEAAAAFAHSDKATAHYNRGNALARAGRLAEALSAYDTALEAQPQHADALHNRALVARLREQLRQLSRQQQRDPKAGGQTQSGGEAGQSERAPDQEARDTMDQSQDADGNRDQADRDPAQAATSAQASQTLDTQPLTAEEQQAMAQWLRRIPDDPGGLLRRKFQLEYSRRRRERPQGTDAW
jgi:Ca-activated chloride channel family protein